MEIQDLLLSAIMACFIVSGGLGFIGTVSRLDIGYQWIPSHFYRVILRSIIGCLVVSFLSIIGLIALPLKVNQICLDSPEKNVMTTYCEKEQFDSLHLNKEGWYYRTKIITRSPQ